MAGNKIAKIPESLMNISEATFDFRKNKIEHIPHTIISF